MRQRRKQGLQVKKVGFLKEIKEVEKHFVD